MYSSELIADLSNNKATYPTSIKKIEYEYNLESKKNNYRSSDVMLDLEKKNVYLTNFFSKLQHAYTSCSNSNLKMNNIKPKENSNFNNQLVRCESNDNISIATGYNFNVLNAEEEKKLLGSNNINDSDLLITEMRSLNTPRELDNSKLLNMEINNISDDDKNAYDLKDLELKDLNHLNYLNDVKKSIENKNELASDNLKSDKNIEKNNKIYKKPLKQKLESKLEKYLTKNSTLHTPPIKKVPSKKNILRSSVGSSNGMNYSNNFIPKEKSKTINIISTRNSTPINCVKASKNVSKDRKTIYVSNTKSTTKSSTSTNNKTFKETTLVKQKRISNNNIVNKSQSDCITRNLNFNYENKIDILSDLEGIFGENLQNFDENLLFSTLEDFDSKFLIKALIFLSFEQKKIITNQNVRLEEETKKRVQLSKELSDKIKSIMSMNEELSSVKSSLKQIISGDNSKLKISVEKGRNSATPLRSNVRSNSQIHTKNLPPKIKK